MHILTYLSEDLFIDREGQIQDVSDVIVLHPLQALVKLLVKVLEITQVCRSKQQQG